jgi:hypothetical protein
MNQDGVVEFAESYHRAKMYQELSNIESETASRMAIAEKKLLSEINEPTEELE